MECGKKLFWGTLAIVIAGSVMHFTFEFLGKWPPIGIIVPVNESVWEHLKLTFYPMLLFWLIAAPRIGVTYKTLSVALVVGIVISLVLIAGIYYLLKSGLGIESLAVDIALSVFAAFLGQWVICHMLEAEIKPAFAGAALCTILIAALVILFSIWTFRPPMLPIFTDPTTGGYGIYKQVPKNAGFVPNDAE